ncbi:MAG TPA: hypothetical protein VHZ03_21225 [Trebonia sp.]|nr:hypothetical protein [Trebonia sp.]
MAGGSAAMTTGTALAGTRRTDDPTTSWIPGRNSRAMIARIAATGTGTSPTTKPGTAGAMASGGAVRGLAVRGLAVRGLAGRVLAGRVLAGRA